MKRQQELHRLVLHNTQQAQRRQKRYFDQRLKDPVAYKVGVKVWVFANTHPRGTNPKLARGWRGPFTVMEVRQNGRCYILDINQKVHFERLKLHVLDPTDWILLENGEVGFVIPEDAENPNEEIPLSEGAGHYEEEQLL